MGQPISAMLPVAVKAAARAFDAIRTPATGLVVLIYHRVGGRTPVRVDLPTPTFRTQMEMLAVSGRVLALDDAIARLASGADLTGSVVVTFDDGTADFVDEALPVLAECGVPATLYVATAHVDESRAFPDDGSPASWAGLRDAATTGLVTFGSHTHSHALLDRLPRRDVEDELDRSIDLLGGQLGVHARHFAYPKALTPTPIADVAVRARFASAALAGTRANPSGTDPFRLRRSPVQTTDRATDFRQKVAGGMRLEDDLRQLVNRRRYRGAIA